MRISVALSSIIVSTFVMAATTAQAGYVYTVIDVPGSTLTETFGVNDSGQATALYDNGTDIFQNGTLTPLPSLSGYTVSGLGINNAGVVVGSAVDALGDEHGMILQGGHYTLFDYPGANLTQARQVDPSGTLITGYYTTSSNPEPQGFLYDSATHTFTNLLPSGALTSIPGEINASGYLVGDANFGDGTGDHAFVEFGNSYTLFQYEGQSTVARGINDSGEISGFLVQSGVGFVVSLADIGDPADYRFFSVSGAVDTNPEAINNDGVIAGDFTNADGTTEGFLATPVPEPATWAMLLFGLFGAGAIASYARRRAVNAA